MSNLLNIMGLLLAAVMLLSGCSADQDNTLAVSTQGGEESIQEETAQSALPEQAETPGTTVSSLQEESEVREGTSDDTLSTPEDFPADYNYGSGLASDWSIQASARLPEPEGNATVLNTTPDLAGIQALYLWEEGNAPAQTEVTRDGYDPAGFRPYVTAIPVREGTDVKGAVVLLAGGAFQARANYTDTLPTAAIYESWDSRPLSWIIVCAPIPSRKARWT